VAEAGPAGRSADLDRRTWQALDQARGRVGQRLQPLRISAEELTGHIGYLREQLTRYGRQPDDVTISLGVSAHAPGTKSESEVPEWELAGDPDASADKLRTYQQAGVQHLLVNCPRGTATSAMLESYEYVAREVRPRLEAP